MLKILAPEKANWECKFIRQLVRIVSRVPGLSRVDVHPFLVAETDDCRPPFTAVEDPP
jgi:hypothetical protein